MPAPWARDDGESVTWDERLVTRAEIARLLGVTVALVRRWALRPDFPAPAEIGTYHGRPQRRWRLTDVLTWLAHRDQQRLTRSA